MHVDKSNNKIWYQVAEGAKFRGASKIIGVDLNPNKFEIGDQDCQLSFNMKFFLIRKNIYIYLYIFSHLFCYIYDLTVSKYYNNFSKSLFSNAGKRFGVTDFINPAATDGKPVSEVGQTALLLSHQVLKCNIIN